MAMNDVFDPVPVAHDRVRLGDLAIDGSHPRLQRVSLRRRKKAHVPSAKEKKKKEKSPHIILDRAVAELGRHNLQYLTVKPTTFGHRRVRVPIRRDLAKARTRGRGCWCRSGDSVRRHGGEDHTTEDVSELVRWWNEDEREVHLVRVEREDGQRGGGPVQLRNRTDRREREQWTQFEVIVTPQRRDRKLDDGYSGTPYSSRVTGFTS
jgi:hypothetical protein